MNEEKVRVLHILHGLNVGGMEGRVCRLAKGLGGEFDITIATLRKSFHREIPLPPGVRRHHLEIPPGLKLGSLWAVWSFIRKGKFHIVHTHNWSSMFYGVIGAWLACTPVIFHGEHGLETPDGKPIPARRLLVQGLLARLAKRIVAVNGSIARHVREKWRTPEAKLLTLPNGVDLEKFPYRPAAGGEFVIGTVGRHDPVKDLGCLLRGFKLFLDGGGTRNSRLILVGYGPGFDATKDLIAELGISDRVLLAGDQKHPEEWYPRFSVYVNTSLYEGMSNTILEAMASGLPVVASSVAGNRDLLRDDNALFFGKGDPSALAAQLRLLSEDPPLREKMGRINRSRVESEFNNRDFLVKYRQAYLEALASAKRGGGSSGRP